MVITPIVVSHDRSPGIAVSFWWARVGPVSYGIYELRAAPAVVLIDEPADCPNYESLTQAWLSVAETKEAEVVFESLVTSNRPAARVYGLLGLIRSESSNLQAALDSASGDTSRVQTLRWSVGYALDSTRTVADLASLDSLTVWANTMEQLRVQCSAQ